VTSPVLRVDHERPSLADIKVADGRVVGARYTLLGKLGQGGMAVVHEALDNVTGQRIALKRLRILDDGRKQRRAVELFEREFHTLAQLRHPRIIEVYDYRLDDEGPYYTMELLDGGDLQQLVPADWRKACAVARDVCSALSLLHSRRAVHRDLSPRNVRCTSTGLAKLIDFGAMVPMGRNKYVVVGTPAYCAPEVVHLQPLDARTDLYALGATLYYTLAGRHAFPARDFESLGALWQCAFPRPSEFSPDIPEALDALVMDLLRLDPAARPPNAAEVLERLSAIDGCSLSDNLPVAQAFLSTPSLSGRDTQLSRARMKTMRALRKRGSALLVEGPSGVGRSRFLDACALEGKLLGAVVLRADADDADDTDYSVIRALARQLLATMPDETNAAARPHLRLLGRAIPELVNQLPHRTSLELEDPVLARPRLQPALREWLLAISRQRPLLVTVDDVHRIDEPSAAAIALLSHNLRPHRIAVIVSAETGAPAVSAAAMKLLGSNATHLALENLSSSDVQRLLGSVFGEVPRANLLAHRLHAISGGNPRDVMRLAQHVVDRGVVRYEAGAWSISENFDAADLPSSMAQALSVRVDALSAGAKQLARTISVSPGLSLTFQECLHLSAQDQSGRLMESLDELLTAEVMREAGERFTLTQRAWEPALQTGMSAAEARELHVRVARLFELRGTDQFRVAQHLLRANERERAVEILAAFCLASVAETHKNPEAFFVLTRSLPIDWSTTFDEAVRLCNELNLPKRYKFALQDRFVGIVSLMTISDPVHVPALIADLTRLSGLADFAEIDASLEPMARAMTALGRAQARYAATSEHDRVLDPGEAIRHLARAILSAAGMVTSCLDFALLNRLPSLSPLSPLSPALGVIENLMRGMKARQTARMEQAREFYEALLERSGQPDRAGLDESHHRYTRLGVMNGLGMIEAGMGLSSCLEYASKIESEPTLQVNAVQIRVLYHLWQGDFREALRLKHEIEILRIQNSPRQWYEGSHVLWQVTAFAAAEDLTRLKQATEDIEELAGRFPGWVPVHRYSLGEYQRVRGDQAGALAELETALELTKAGESQVWPNIAGAHLRVLIEKDPEEAVAVGERYLAAGEAAGLGYVMNYVLLPFSIAQAKVGKIKEAEANADLALRRFEALGTTGLNLGITYETRARVAILANDQETFERYATLCEGVYTAAGSPTLVAKFEKLRREAQRAEVMTAVMQQRPGELNELFTVSRIVSTLEACRGVTERAQTALNLLAQASGATEGFLLLVGDQGPFCAAQIGDRSLSPALFTIAREYLAAEAHEAQTTTNSGTDNTSGRYETRGGTLSAEFRPVLLSHATPTGLLITGIALLVVPSGGRFAFPARVATEISRRFHQTGDSSGVLVVD